MGINSRRSLGCRDLIPDSAGGITRGTSFSAFSGLVSLSGLGPSTGVRGLFCSIIVKYEKILFKFANEAVSCNVICVLEFFSFRRVCFTANSIDKTIAVVAAISLGPNVEHGVGVISVDVGRPQGIVPAMIFGKHLKILTSMRMAQNN
jgi:hypothetical protein